jgi:hypothetical protein
MKCWGLWMEDKCPRCGEPEDTAHVWICQGKGTIDIWDKAVEALELWLRTVNMDPKVTHLIIQYLNGWRCRINPAYEAPPGFQDVVRNQNQIGWQRFIEGWLTKDWAAIQQQYYELIRPHRTGRRWAMALIKKLWETAWDLWEHRNDIFHEQENIVTRIMGAHLNHQVARLHRHLLQLPLRHNDHHLLSLKLSTLLRKDARYKEAWLEVAGPALRHKRKGIWLRQMQRRSMISGMKRTMSAGLNR